MRAYREEYIYIYICLNKHISSYSVSSTTAYLSDTGGAFDVVLTIDEQSHSAGVVVLSDHHARRHDEALHVPALGLDDAAGVVHVNA